MTAIDRSQLAQVGKWLEGSVAILGFRMPEAVAVAGIRGPGETMFYLKRQVTRRGRRCAEYQSFAGRQLRVWLDPEEPES